MQRNVKTLKYNINCDYRETANGDFKNNTKVRCKYADNTLLKQNINTTVNIQRQ